MHTSPPQPALDPTIVDDQHPWPGLASFREQDAHFFKGREHDIEELHCLVYRQSLTVLFGVSGLGKSSLLQAGLFPLLRQDNRLPVMIRLDFTSGLMNLREQVFAAIARQVQENNIEAPFHTRNETLWEYFHRKDSEFWDTRNRITVPVLCFDQFEEIFTLGHENRERAADADYFILELADLVEGRCPERVKARVDANPDEAKNFNFSRHPYKLILSLREDYLANLEELRGLMPSIIHNRMRLLRMNGVQALDVANLTNGRLMDLRVAESVVRLVAAEHDEQRRELVDLPIEPALLSLFCRELNERRIGIKANRIDAQTVDTNRERILEAFYERSLADQSLELRRFIEDELITVKGYRNSEAYDNALEIPGITAEALATLVQRRLLVLKLEEQDGVKRIELIHDVLTGVVSKSRDRRQMLEKQRNEEQARIEAEQREHAAREELRANKRRFLIFLMLITIAFLASAWGWWSWSDATESRKMALSGKSRQLAAQATLLADTASDDTKIERAAALAIESWQLQHNATASSAANKLLRMLPKYRIRHDQAVHSIALSPDGSLLATGSKDNMLRLFNIQNGNELYHIEYGDWVNGVDFSPDGRFVATASKDKTIRLIETANGREVFRALHNGEVRMVIFSSDGRLLATASRDHTARLIDVMTGKELRQIKHGDEVFNIAFSPDSRVLATASRDNLARLIDTKTGKVLAQVDHGAEVTHVTFSADGRLLATASANTARLIDASTGKELRRIQHQDSVSSLAFSPDGRWLATGSDDDTARVTEVSTGSVASQFLDRKEIYSVRFSPNGKLLAISSLDGTARLIETATWQEVTRIIHGGAVWNIVFSLDSQLLATVSMDNNYDVYNTNNVVRLFETVKNPDDIKIKQNAGIMGIAFSPNGRLLATASKTVAKTDFDTDTNTWIRNVIAPATAKLIDVNTGKEMMVFEHTDSVYGVVFSRDGRYLATSSKDHTAKLFDTISGTELTTVIHKGEVRTLAFSPDGRWLATGSLDKSVKVIDTATGEEMQQKIEAGGEIRFVTFSFDGQLLAIASQDGAKLIDTKTWLPTKPIKLATPVSHLAFSPDGRLLATANDNMARLFNVSNGKEVAEFEHAGTVLSVAFSPDGTLLATSSMDNAARLFDINSGDLIASIKHGGPVTSIAFSPTGKFLATGSQDSTTRLIETLSGLEIETISHDGDVWSVAFSPDEKLLASGVSDGHVQLQDTDPQRVFDLLCSKAGRNLTPDELHDYLGINAPHQTCKNWRESEVFVPAR